MDCLGLDGPNPAVLAAIEKLGSRCVAAEVAAESGLSVAAAEDELNALLARGGGRFEVCGDRSKGSERVVYSFPLDLKARIAKCRRHAAVLDAWDRSMPVCLFAVRFTLGIFIFVSLAIIALVVVVLAVAALAALVNSGNARDNRNVEFGGWSLDRIQAKLNRLIAMWNQAMCIYMCFGGGNPFFIPPIFDPYYYAFAYGAWGHGGAWRRPRFCQGGFYRRREWLQPWQRDASEPAAASAMPAQLINGRIVREAVATGSSAEGTNVVESVFSFLFGDGPPQPGLLEYWRLVAAFIRQHNGVVTSEMLTPYLEQPPPAPSASLDIEDWIAWTQSCDACVIPVLEHFRGRAEATDNGSGLVYVFPELLGAKAAKILGVEEQASKPVAKRLVEGEWQFSRRSSWEIRCSLVLGFVNLLGVGWLYSASFSRHGSVARLLGPGSAQLLAALTRFALLPYALLFLLVPGIRGVWLSWTNRGVRLRNQVREAHAARLEAADQVDSSINCQELREKLQHADRLRRIANLRPSGPTAADAV